ncbi:MAG: ABC transporter substrate-binding protein [Lachnospiraceae bacterium]|nr:ABC transporter substrate-binding protein [Lachnospiraceae bacterium]
MRKIITFIIYVVMCFSLVAVVGCSASRQQESAQPRIVVDMCGKEISIPETVDKYCILYSSAVPMCGMLDKGLDHMVMCPTLYADWTYRLFPNLDEHAITVDKRSVTAEQIVESGAQVVFWSSATHTELVESLELLNVACVNVAVSNADDLKKAMGIIADIFGTEYAKKQVAKFCVIFDEYHQYATEHVTNIPENERLSVLVLGGVDDTTGFGGDAYEPYWASIVGLNYIYPSNDGAGKVTLTMEQIYEFDPDIIIIEGFFDEESVYTDPAWNALRAVQNNKLISNPSVLDTWSKPGPEDPLQYIWGVSRFYPDYAGEIDVVAETILFYKELYQYDMSEDEANEILAGHRIIFE